jgi:hypothetical protein
MSMTVLGGCGGSSASHRASDAASSEIRALVASFKHALKTGDFPLACDYLSSASQRAMVANFKRTVASVTSCKQVMRLIAASASKQQIQTVASQMEVRDVLLNGDHATIVISQAGKREVRTAVKEGRAWKLAE